MKIIIETEPKEIAALVVTIQERQGITVDEVIKELADKLSATISLEYTGDEAVNRYRSLKDRERFSPEFQNKVQKHFAGMTDKQVYDALNA